MKYITKKRLITKILKNRERKKNTTQKALSNPLPLELGAHGLFR